jgi:hypothetical protein
MEHHQPPHVLALREVLNMHWPTNPAAFQHRTEGIRVRVRLVWERDGEEYLEGVATRWDADHVYVEIRHENRLQGNGVWVKPSDVFRRSPKPVPSSAQERADRPVHDDDRPAGGAEPPPAQERKA